MKKILILGALISGSAMAADLSVKDCLIQEVVPGKAMTGGFSPWRTAARIPSNSSVRPWKKSLTKSNCTK